MNVSVMLDEALKKIDSMSIDEFKKECQKAGYNPVLKNVIPVCDECDQEMEAYSSKTDGEVVRGWKCTSCDLHIIAENDSSKPEKKLASSRIHIREVDYSTNTDKADVLILYRHSYNQSSYGKTRLYVDKYRVIKETEKGYWIVPEHTLHAENNQYSNKRWVSKTGRKRFAYPTVSESEIGFITRSLANIRHLKRRIQDVENALRAIPETSPNFSWVPVNSVLQKSACDRIYIE